MTRRERKVRGMPDIKNSFHQMLAAPLVVGVLLSNAVAEEALPPPRGDSVVVEGETLELLYTRTSSASGGLTEGPAVAPDGRIYFSDIVAGESPGQILRFDPKTLKTELFAANSFKSNGLAFNPDGHLVACEGADFGARGLSRWDVKTRQRTVLAQTFEGKNFNSPNDLVIDDRGRIYFTDPRYAGEESREIDRFAVYRLELDGEVIEITSDVEKPNGIALSPNQKILYVADTNNGTDRIDAVDPAKPPALGAMKLYAFSLDRAGKVRGPRRLLHDFGKVIGCDGMTVDVEGNIYATSRNPARPGVLVLTPAGEELGFIPTGNGKEGAAAAGGLPSNCVFGLGEEASRLYVTVAKSLYRIRLKVPGHHAPWINRLELLRRFRSEFIAIAPGTERFPEEFVVGETTSSDSSASRRSVKLSQPFHIAKYEVPQNLWHAVMGENPSRWPGPRNSVELLSFGEAEAFCRRVTQLMRTAGLIARNEIVRLPSEVEWEYCARAGTSTRYSFGDEVEKLGDYGWFTGNAAGNDPPVGAKKPNPWGLYDVHGYLWEWCQDHWRPNLADGPEDGRAWLGGDGQQRVLRGGSWKDPPAQLTSAFRRQAAASLRDDAVGLRCVLASASEESSAKR